MRKICFSLLLLFSALASSATVYTVTDTTANSTSSLAYAIAQANAHLGRDTIEFNIPGGAFWNKIASDSLPDITDTLFINGLSQPGNDSTNLLQLKIYLIGDKGLTVHSAGCTINGLKISSQPSLGFCINVEADSSKSFDNTTITSCFTNSDAGIKIYPISNFSLNSSNIIIRNVAGYGTGANSSSIYILPSTTSDIRQVYITNCSYSIGIHINRQNFSVPNPHYFISGNWMGGLYLLGNLDSIYVGNNTINRGVDIRNASINNSIVELNTISDQVYGAVFSMKDFLNDTIRDLKIINNKFVGGDEIHFDFSGNNQVFDSIFFENNNCSYLDIFFEKTNFANTDTQFVKHLFIRDNYSLENSQPRYWQAKFMLSGLSNFANIYIGNNQMTVEGKILVQSDNSVLLNSFYITGNNIQSTYPSLLDFRIDGGADSISILSNMLAFDTSATHGGADGISFDSDGEISHLKVNSNNISMSGDHDGVFVGSSGIRIININAQGEIKHNNFVNCTDAGIFVERWGNDSNSVLEIDSNTFSGSYYYAVGIMSSPYNPPSQNIGTYTMLGNSIYNIGQEGIYRFSQHDTASCMTCIPKPQLLTAEYNGGITSVTASLTGDTLTDYIIEYFSNTAPDTGGYTEGQFFIFRDTITTDGTGNAVFLTDIPGNYLNAFITSTATSMATYQTSEFSNEAGVVLGVGKEPKENDVLIFPNPVSDKLYVSLPSGKNVRIVVLDQVGRTLLQTQQSKTGLTVIDTKDFSAGIYLVKLDYEGKTVVKKIIKN